jgi:mRNA-degrading endonuclease RelE of RelBE toxin-antitoxin system
MTTKVIITKQADKDLSKAPKYIADKLEGWIEFVETDGIEEVNKHGY